MILRPSDLRVSLLKLVTVLTITIFVSTASALDYVESSASLAYPEWEGGHTELEFADIDGDGNPDIISIGDHGSPFINTQIHGIMVYFGNGAGSFTLEMVGDFGYGGIAAGDLNNDGFIDVGYGMHHNYSSTDLGDQLIETALGDGSGTNWIPWDDNLASQGESYGMFATDFADVDNDGDLDLASTSFGFGNQLMIYRNQSDGTWQHTAALAGGNCNMVVQFGDINNDGNIDIASSYQNGTVYFGHGTGAFYNADYNLPTPGSMGHAGVSLGDVDGDGGVDLAFCTSNGLNVWIFDENQTAWINYSGALASAGSGYSYTQLCDMNADGECDIVAGGDGRVTVWTGEGAGNWTPAAQYTILNDPDCGFEFMRAGGDIDHNGYPDIMHLTDEGSWINSYNHLRLYKESSLGDEVNIIPVFPRGGENFIGGGVRFIDWLSEVPRGETAIVDIDFSSAGPAGPWTTLAENLPNSGRFQWTLPDNITSENCYLKLTAVGSSTAEAITPAAFALYRPQDLASINLNPLGTPIVIPAGGGSFNFELVLEGNENIPCSFDGWIDVELPGGSTYGPIIYRPGLKLPVEGYVFRQMTQAVPASAPSGTYTYRAHIGVFANGFVWAEDTFTFEKSGTDNPRSQR